MFLPILALLVGVISVQGVLQPPYSDIAKGKKITATATCGEDYTPPSGAPGELFCALAEGPRKFGDSIKGFSCSHCVPGDYGNNANDGQIRDHNIRNANDGSNRWWQSPPLSRGLQYRQVNVTIDLGQSYHIAYVIVKSANSPRPGVWALERSNDGGKTYSPWHYFAPSAAECRQNFGVDSLQIQADDTVLCSTEYSQIPPFKDGEEWTTATNIRLRLLDVRTLLTDFLPRSLQDPTVTRRYYYSIKDISIGGRCMCNGFADECRPNNVGKHECVCQYNTQGPRCNECKPGYEQKKWRPRTELDKFECEKCNCHGHSNECKYIEDIEKRKLSLDINGKYTGGGVCQNCAHSTVGANCEMCKAFFYRLAGVDIRDKIACQPCNCNPISSTGLCAEETGQCQCKEKYTGRKCNRCNIGYYQFPECKKCECDINGSKSGECVANLIDGCSCKEGYTGKFCDSCKPGFYGYPNCQACECSAGAIGNNCEQATGKCRCTSGFIGRQCDKCGVGHYLFPFCNACRCDPKKTMVGVCNPQNGVCKCKKNYRGKFCQECAYGYHGHPTCFACECATAGSRYSNCDQVSGRCLCRPNFEGLRCDQCKRGYYGYPNCQPCDCNDQGSQGSYCNSSTGQCQCKAIYTGLQCDRCLAGFFGFPNCKQCQCNLAGTYADPGKRFGDCSTSNIGQCVCKNYVIGLECSKCKSGYYNLQESNPLGCTDCDCYQQGTNNGLTACDDKGECNCKAFVGSKKCRNCDDGFYGLEEKNMFGCTRCDCDVGGAISNICGKSDGQCRCRPNIIGRQCNKVKPKYYFPTFHQLKFELEDGQTEVGDAIRFDYQEKKFPGFSWKGFVIINDKQPSVVMKVNVPISSKYLVMFKYVSNQISRVPAAVSANKINGGNIRFSGVVNFESTQRQNGFSVNFAKVEEGGGTPLYFPLNAGEWVFNIQSKGTSELLLDYMILVPQQYVQASTLQKYAQIPCSVDTTDKLCDLYKYIDLNRPGFISMEAEKPGRARLEGPLFNDTKVLSKLDYKAMVLLSPKHQELNIIFHVPKPGRYVAVLQYYHDSDDIKYIDVYIRSRANVQRGRAWLYSCKYIFGCRQAILTTNSKSEMKFDIKNTEMHMLTLYARNGLTVAIDSVILIPEKEWSMDYATPKFYCTTKDGKCTTMNYIFPKDSIRINAKAGENDPQPSFVKSNVKVKYFKPGTNIFNLKDSKAGRHLIFVHYFQPKNPSFTAQIIVYSGRGSGIPGTIDFAVCPNLDGCRAAVKSDRPYTFEAGLSRFRVNIPESKDVWVEYVLLAPDASKNKRSKRALVGSTPDLKDTNPVDFSKEFNEQCSGTSFDVKPGSSQFCINSVFSLASIFNNGALSCDCDTQGSTSQYCQEFGGQCPCRPNVIGRQCTRCKVGYYGFPNCRPCNWTLTLTGQCTCPSGVIGDKCDRCQPGTFGYDPVIGCQPCNCDPIGTGKKNAVCDIKTGQCPCVANYGSRNCSQCAVGYYNYPLCDKCDCFAAGVTGAKCNAKTGDCICKDNVVGSTCNECPKGFFKTGKGFDQLCTKCWCHGRSTLCKEAQLYHSVITATEGWTISTADVFITRNADKVQAIFILLTDPNIIYWIAPGKFLGNQVTSYSGNLSYHFDYNLKVDAAQPLNNYPDIIIKGGGMEIKSNKDHQRLNGFKNLYAIQLHEKYWLRNDGSPIIREQMLTVLSRIESLRIRATHDINIATSTLYDVKMDSAVKNGKDLIFGIEECVCPIEYVGPSCSECAQGFTRRRDGTCGKCECSGKSDRCHPENGSCFNCTGNALGDHCEKCKDGYYGDKCERCPCPSKDPNNNFADSCGVNLGSGELVCKCKKGYTGLRCDKCADGYYGNPRVPGGSCQPCSCSGNIDLKLTGNCNAVTGECYKCLNNSHGNACQYCKPGFFGDAVDKKNCQDCKCDSCGSNVSACNRVTGQCQCKRNVEGDRCNKCKLNTGNFDTCLGCEECNCGPASISQQCDLKTGKCECIPSVTGKQCDRCVLGFYGYTSGGCKKCNCPNGGYCDVKTGNCDCGILGETCTLCPPGHIIENGKCVECGSCLQNILHRVNIFTTHENYTNVFHDDDFINSTLIAVNKTLGRHVEKANIIENDLEVLRKAIGFGDYGKYDGDLDFYSFETFRDCQFGLNTNKSITTTATTTTVDTPINSQNKRRKRRDAGVCPASLSKLFEKSIENFNTSDKKITKLRKDAEYSSSTATETKQRAQDLLDSIKKFTNELEAILNFGNSTLESLNTSTNSNALFTEALEILKELRNLNISIIENDSQREKEFARNASAIADQLKEQANRISQRAAKFNETVEDLLNAFKHLRNESDVTNKTIDHVFPLLNMAKDIDWKTLLDTAKLITNSSSFTLNETMDLLMAVQSTLNAAETAYQQFSSNTRTLEELMKQIPKFLQDLIDELSTAIPIVARVMRHTENLRKLANELDGVLDDTKKYSQTALDAARVYSTIVKAIEDALAAARLSNRTAHQANEKANTATGSASNYKSKSDAINEEAIALKNATTNLKVSIKGVDMRLDELRGLRRKIEGRVDEVKDNLVTFEREKAAIGKEMNVSNGANITKEIARSGEDLANNITDQVKKDEAIVEDLKRNITDLNDLIKKVKENVTKLEDKISDMNISSVQDAKRKYEQIEETFKNNVTISIEYIKYVIAYSRFILDHLRLSTKFNESSVLILNTPKAAYDPSMNNDISLLFTIDNGVTDGFLFFIGNGDNPDSKDYLALEIVDGNVRFHYKLSSGDAQNVTVKHKIVTNIQYRIEISRTFGNASIMLSKIIENGIEERLASQQHAAVIENPNLNLGAQSDLFFGGIPSGKNIPSALGSRTYKGCMERLEYSKQTMGLWNYQVAEDVDGCVNEYRILTEFAYILDDEDSNINLDIRLPPSDGLSRIDLEFVTLSKDGLIFVGMDPPSTVGRNFAMDSMPPNFFALQLEDGYLVSLFNYGGGYMKIKHESIGRMNDGKIHNFTMRAKAGKFVRIWVDTSTKGPRADDVVIEGPAKFLVSKAYVGRIPKRGYTPNENILQKSFIGSIRNIEIRSCVNCGRARSGFEYRLGFEIPFGHSASFPTKNSSISVPACSITAENPFALSFQTNFKNGTMVFANGPFETKLKITMDDGQVKVMLTQNNIEINLKSSIKGGLSDGKWHTLALVVENGIKMILYLGTDNGLVSSSKPLPSDIVLSGMMHFGGLPYLPDVFIGNIRQVFICGSQLDLFDGEIKNDAVVGSAFLTAPLNAALPPTTSPPTAANASTTTLTTTTPTIIMTTMTTTTTTPTTTTSPEPTTTAPEPVTSTPEPTPTTPVATTTTPETTTTTPEPTTTTPETTTTTPEPTTTTTTKTTTIVTPKPTTTTPEPTTTTPEPTTTTPKPTTTATTKTTTIVTPEPTTITAEPITTPEPTTTTPEPTTTTTTIVPPEPTTTTAEPTTTTLKPTTTTTKTTAPAPICSSKLEPVDQAYGFGMEAESYIEFRIMKGSLDKKSQFEFSFYTMEADGILLSVNMKGSYDYEAVYLSDGKVNYIFNAGTGPLELETPKAYNDGKWHKVQVKRAKNQGYLYIDGSLVVNSVSKGSASFVNNIEKVYFGGVPTGAKIPTQLNNIKSLKGGMKDFKSLEEALVTPAAKIGTTEAYRDGLSLTNAISIGSKGGYAQKYNSLNVGQEFSLLFDVHARVSAGTLFHVEGPIDFLIIKIEKDGSIKVICNNGDGVYSLAHKPDTSICNGELYKLRLDKQGRILKFYVNGVLTEKTTTTKKTDADTNSPAYFGGLPAEKQPKGYEPFSGCISRVKINGNPVDLINDVIKKGAIMSGCAGGAV